MQGTRIVMRIAPALLASYGWTAFLGVRAIPGNTILDKVYDTLKEYRLADEAAALITSSVDEEGGPNKDISLTNLINAALKGQETGGSTQQTLKNAIMSKKSESSAVAQVANNLKKPEERPQTRPRIQPPKGGESSLTGRKESTTAEPKKSVREPPQPKPQELGKDRSIGGHERGSKGEKVGSSTSGGSRDSSISSSTSSSGGSSGGSSSGGGEKSSGGRGGAASAKKEEPPTEHKPPVQPSEAASPAVPVAAASIGKKQESDSAASTAASLLFAITLVAVLLSTTSIVLPITH